MYPFDSWSSIKLDTSFYSSGESGISRPFFGLNVSLRSMAWSQGFLIGILSDSFFKNTFRYWWYICGTRFAGFEYVLGADSSCFKKARICARESRSLDSICWVKGGFSFKMWHVQGQRVILTIPVVQSISGYDAKATCNWESFDSFPNWSLLL